MKKATTTTTQKRNKVKKKKKKNKWDSNERKTQIPTTEIVKLNVRKRES